MKNIIKCITLFILIIMFIVVFINIKSTSIESSLLYGVDLDKADNIMVSAHPDDETLWGGEHLLSENYLVVCVTCVDEIRIKEFKTVMNKTNSEYIILGYPDKTNNQRDDWVTSYDGIKRDLKVIVDSKKWNKIVTHNPDGEYGHIHHELVSKIMTEISDKDKLYYFNKYLSNEELSDNNKKMSDNKKILLNEYKSQKDIINNHYLNSANEKFISYYDWEK